MRADDVEVQEAWAPRGLAARQHGGRALMLPGRAYSCQMSLLFWTTRALQAQGWRVVQAAWDPDDLPDDLVSFVTAVAQRLDDAGPSERPVLIVGKSLGTLAAPWAAERGYPAAWLTPILTDAGLHEVLGSYPARNIVVGGTADDLWQPGFSGTGEVLEIEDGDHGLEVHDWSRSLLTHREVAEAVAGFAGTTLP